MVGVLEYNHSVSPTPIAPPQKLAVNKPLPFAWCHLARGSGVWWSVENIQNRSESICEYLNFEFWLFQYCDRAQFSVFYLGLNIFGGCEWGKGQAQSCIIYKYKASGFTGLFLTED